MPFLGHVVSGEGVRIDSAKVRAVHEWPVPRDLRELRSFSSFCSCYWQDWDTLRLEDGILEHKWVRPDGQELF